MFSFLTSTEIQAKCGQVWGPEKRYLVKDGLGPCQLRAELEYN